MSEAIPVDREGNLSRKQVWLAAWLSVATATDCKKSSIAAQWADQCLADFDKRFPASAGRDAEIVSGLL